MELGVDRRGQPAVRLLALAALEQLARDPRAALVVALQRRAHRAHAVAVDQQRGLLRGLGELGVAREVRVGLVEPAQLEQRARAPDVRVGGAGDRRRGPRSARSARPPAPAAPPRGRAASGRAGRRSAPPPAAGPAAPGAPSRPPRRRSPDVGLGDLRDEAAVDREPGEDLRAHRGVLLGQPPQGLLQQRDVLGVLDAELLPGAAGVPERRAGEAAASPASRAATAARAKLARAASQWPASASAAASAFSSRASSAGSACSSRRRSATAASSSPTASS